VLARGAQGANNKDERKAIKKDEIKVLNKIKNPPWENRKSGRTKAINGSPALF